MKIKIAVIDLEIPPRVKKWALRIGIPLGVLFGGGAAAWAGGLVTWNSGQTLKASDLNANFAYLQSEITTLQGQVATPSAFRAIATTGTTIPSGQQTAMNFQRRRVRPQSGIHRREGHVFSEKRRGLSHY